MELSKNELLEVKGGIGAWGVIGIIAGVIFIVGVVDGYVRPLACN